MVCLENDLVEVFLLFLIMFLLSWNEHLKFLFMKFLEALRYCLCLFTFVSRARLLRAKIFTFCDSFERVKLMSDPAVNTTGQVFFFLRSQYIDLTAFYNTTLSILVAAKSVETGVTTIVLIYRSSFLLIALKSKPVIGCSFNPPQNWKEFVEGLKAMFKSI